MCLECVVFDVFSSWIVCEMSFGVQEQGQLDKSMLIKYKLKNRTYFMTITNAASYLYVQSCPALHFNQAFGGQSMVTVGESQLSQIFEPMSDSLPAQAVALSQQIAVSFLGPMTNF